MPKGVTYKERYCTPTFKHGRAIKLLAKEDISRSVDGNLHTVHLVVQHINISTELSVELIYCIY